MRSKIWFTKRSKDYSTRKSTKLLVYYLRGSFHLENGSVCRSGPTDSIAKVLTDVHKNFDKKDIANLDHQNIHGL
ncbi:hypothetical protein H5410_056485 [Solanum commersonii]|uniref:Uncharacterized protein n=1 Tax=Solanum commersonii TaxID=4109 RepID=A0A9J5WMA8_SOLCO|nr:hypothetical protein H5410_056485 [Solanum commersonii]